MEKIFLIVGKGPGEYGLTPETKFTSQNLIDISAPEEFQIPTLTSDLTNDGNGDGYPFISSNEIYDEKTFDEISTLISDSQLKPGALYKITGTHPTLYNDGNNLGTTIFLRALTNNKLESKGFGEFYNPEYNNGIPGFGIWSNLGEWTISNITGGLPGFYVDEEFTSDTGGSGKVIGYGLVDKFINYTGFFGGTVAVITGSISGATADVTIGALPNFYVGQRLIWGGYVWNNLTGNQGYAPSSFELDAVNWEKVPYNDVTNVYNKVYDEIEFDFENNWITKRFDKIGNNLVCGSFDQSYDGSNIPYFMFGNPLQDGSSAGISNNTVTGGYVDIINFRGSVFSDNIFIGSESSNNLFFPGCYINNNNFKDGSSLSNNIITDESSISYNICELSCIMFDNIITNNGAITNNKISNQSNIAANLIIGTNIINNNLFSNSTIFQNILKHGNGIYENNLEYNSTISWNKMNLSTIRANQLWDDSKITYNIIESISSIKNNSLKNLSEFRENNFTNGAVFSDNELYQSGITTTILDDKKIMYVKMTATNISVADWTGVTLLSQAFVKEIYVKPNASARMRYYNDSDQLTFSNPIS